jgi:putative DNA primase/helicase
LRFGRNDHGNALRLNALYGDRLRYCHPFKKWLIWDGRRWAIDETEQARKLATLTMVELLSQAVGSRAQGDDDGHNEYGNKWKDFASASLNSGAITNMLRMAQSEIFIQPAELDVDPDLLNFQNGTVDLRTGKLRPHRREDFITKLVHYDYRPTAPCPIWSAFLHQAMNENTEMVRYLQVAIGYSLTGCTIEKAVFVLFGDGNNGKTTFLNTIYRLIKEYATLVQIESLMARQDSSNIQADLADLRGARFAQTSESEAGARLSQAKLKRITQGMGDIKAVRKYENPFEFRETHKLWMDTNRKPSITDAGDKATFNRLHPIPFTICIPKDRIDRDLPQKLIREAPGILAWAVAGAIIWYQERLSKPPAVEAANTEWQAESDRLKLFLAARCTMGSGSAGAQRLYDGYVIWANGAGERQVLNHKDFSAKIHELPGVTKRKTKYGAEYLQLRLLRGPDP